MLPCALMLQCEIFLFLCTNNLLKFCDFKAAAEVQLALKIVVQQVTQNSFQMSADCIAVECYSEGNCIRGFLSATDWRYGCCPELLEATRYAIFSSRKLTYRLTFWMVVDAVHLHFELSGCL
jgi:hypothetical protein